jgi:hypothetical protein
MSAVLNLLDILVYVCSTELLDILVYVCSTELLDILVYVCSTEFAKCVLQFRTDFGSHIDGQTLSQLCE